MIRYLLDSNAVMDWMNGRYDVDKRVNDARVRGHVIGTCEPVVAELFHGVENSASRDRNLILLRRQLAVLKCWPLSRSASEQYGRLMTVLRQKGLQIGQMDVLIASVALTLPHCIVVSCDKDLVRIPGLTVENWRSLPEIAKP